MRATPNDWTRYSPTLRSRVTGSSHGDFVQYFGRPSPAPDRRRVVTRPHRSGVDRVAATRLLGTAVSGPGQSKMATTGWPAQDPVGEHRRLSLTPGLQRHPGVLVPRRDRALQLVAVLRQPHHLRRGSPRDRQGGVRSLAGPAGHGLRLEGEAAVAQQPDLAARAVAGDQPQAVALDVDVDLVLVVGVPVLAQLAERSSTGRRARSPDRSWPTPRVVRAERLPVGIDQGALASTPSGFEVNCACRCRTEVGARRAVRWGDRPGTVDPPGRSPW